MARGWKGNALGLQRWQVELVHNAAIACMIGIENKVAAGMTFDAAKAAVIRQAAPSWKGFTPDVAEGIRRVVSSYTYSDMSLAIHRKHADDFLASIEKRRGYRAGWMERALYRLTGLVWAA